MREADRAGRVVRWKNRKYIYIVAPGSNIHGFCYLATANHVRPSTVVILSLSEQHVAPTPTGLA